MLLLRHLDKTSHYALLGGTAVSRWIECSSPRITLVLLPLMVRTVLRCRQGAKISSGPSFYICCRLWPSCQGSFREAKHISQFSSVQFSSVTQSCPTLCDPMNRSTPGLPVNHQLPEFTQTHVHRASDAMQPSHPLSSPSPPACNPSEHQSLFQ